MRHIRAASAILALSVFVIFPAAEAAKNRQAPLTFEEAQAMALQKVPGIVVDTERSIHNGGVVFEFDIRQEDGAVMDIEIDSVTREVLEMKVDKQGTGTSLPEPAIKPDQAGQIAIDHIKKNTSGLRQAEVQDNDYRIVGGATAHVVTLRRGIVYYEVIVDATTGAVRDFRETGR